MKVRKATFLWLGAVVLAAAAIFSVSIFGLNNVQIILVNQSGQTIEVITIVPEANLGETVHITNLMDGETKEVSFEGAESEYYLSAKLADGKILDSGSYVEGGYTITHRFDPNEIDKTVRAGRFMVSGLIGLASVAILALLTLIYFLFLIIKFILWIVRKKQAP